MIQHGLIALSHTLTYRTVIQIPDAVGKGTPYKFARQKPKAGSV
jgi:hypothetical protein